SGKHLKIRVEPVTPEISKEGMDRAIQLFIETVRQRITITPDVEVVEIGKLSRFELKATRVIREDE
ncbi:MAG: hypothetical protein JRJ82_24245, partial [Deltaproteobacteria bacterium]|nr:hypothetical protein [Deltaproteobacteria bacterium]